MCRAPRDLCAPMWLTFPTALRGGNDHFFPNVSPVLVALPRALSGGVRLCRAAGTFLHLPVCPQAGHGHGWNPFLSRPGHRPAPAQQIQNDLQPGVRSSFLFFLLLLLCVHFFTEMRKMIPYRVDEGTPRRKIPLKITCSL